MYIKAIVVYGMPLLTELSKYVCMCVWPQSGMYG